MRRVLISTFPSAFLHHGGGEREILLLNEALNGAGIISDIYGPASKAIDAYEALVHFSMVRGSEHIVSEASGRGLKLILWPNLWFVKEPDVDELHYCNQFLSHFDAIVFRSYSEERHFRRYIDISGKQIIHVSPLISPRFTSTYSSDIFRESYGIEKYAIWPGIIEPQKNQLTAIRAFKDLPLNLVISGSVRDPRYLQICMNEAGENILFIPPMPFGSELHLSALRQSNLFVELPLDFPGSSALEASLLGCDLMLSQREWTGELLGDGCLQVDPLNVEAVRETVRNHLEQPYKVARERFEYRTPSQSIRSLLSFLVD